MSSKINTQSNMCEVKWYYHFHQIGPLDRFGLVVVMSINIDCMYVCMYMYVPFSYQLFQGLSSGPDDLNKLFMIDLWSILMKYPDLRVGFRLLWNLIFWTSREELFSSKMFFILNIINIKGIYWVFFSEVFLVQSLKSGTSVWCL